MYRTTTAALAAFATLVAAPLAAQPAAVERSEPTAATRAAQAEVLARYDFTDEQDFDFATRGLIAELPEPFVRSADGRLIRDYRGWELFQGPAPASVNPSLWRLAQVQSRVGLYQVTDRIYQLRGMDLANMTIIVGESGYIVVDPFLAAELAEAALDLVRDALGDKPVTGVILTHSHTDHYGGMLGVVTPEQAASGEVPVIAPEGFIDAITDENIIAGPAMLRRTGIAFGFNLGFGPRESVSYGLGPAYDTGLGPGTAGVAAPNISISEEVETHVIDGLELVFMNMPGAEAPSELVFYVPSEHALSLAEMANATLHNVLTLRGAKVRDTLVWADYLTDMHERFGGDADVAFGSHFWPRFGNDAVREYLEGHRDLYKYLHDQTVRMMNNGMTMEEIAEEIALPEGIERHWFNREYYGTLSHNSKAIYQYYLGWYDANPANLNRHPPEAVAARYVEALGGEERTFALAQNAHADGDYRWASELLKHLLFANPDNTEARLLQASSFEQMGYQAESAMWRSAYLSTAAELRSGPPANFASGAALTGIDTENLLKLAAVRLDPALAGDGELEIGLRDMDSGKRYLVTMRNAVLVHVESGRGGYVELTTNADALGRFILGTPVEELQAGGNFTVDGDADILTHLQSMLPLPTGNFPISLP